MKRTCLLLLVIAALASTISAQNNAPSKPVAIRVGAGEFRSDAESRPRVIVPVAMVASSVFKNSAPAEKTAFDLINAKRAERGIKPLEWSNRLLAVARLHSQSMAEYDFFSHKGIDGKYVSDRADLMNIGDWDSIGENIAFNRGFQDPVAKAVNLWLKSPSHFNNIMNENWKETAIGIAIREDGSYYFTQVFLHR